jgi:orotate phosphoribosyltransferase
MHRTADEWLAVCRAQQALWEYNGDPRLPHVRFTSGLHSSNYFNIERVAEDPHLYDEAVADLVELLESRGIGPTINRVVAPAMGGIPLAHDIARHVANRNGRPCFRSYTEKEKRGTEEVQVFNRTTVAARETVLIAEDVISTGGTVLGTLEAVSSRTLFVIPVFAVLVNRSGKKEIGGFPIVALIEVPKMMWTAEECPLCKAGSEAIRPKDGINWVRLHGR